jgi:hypothetical protein
MYSTIGLNTIRPVDTIDHKEWITHPTRVCTLTHALFPSNGPEEDLHDGVECMSQLKELNEGADSHDCLRAISIG